MASTKVYKDTSLLPSYYLPSFLNRNLNLPTSATCLVPSPKNSFKKKIAPTKRLGGGKMRCTNLFVQSFWKSVGRGFSLARIQKSFEQIPNNRCRWWWWWRYFFRFLLTAVLSNRWPEGNALKANFAACKDK